MQARPMTDEPLDLDMHRGMAAQKATDLRRALAEVESNARNLRERQAHFESQIVVVPTTARGVLCGFGDTIAPLRHRFS